MKIIVLGECVADSLPNLSTLNAIPKTLGGMICALKLQDYGSFKIQFVQPGWGQVVISVSDR